MKRVLLIGLLVYLGITAAFISGCRKEPKNLTSYNPIGNTKKDSIIVYNLLPDINSSTGNGYLLYLNDSLFNYEGATTSGQISYGTAPALTISPDGGTYTIKLAEYPLPNPYTVPVTPAAPSKNPDPSAVKFQMTVKLPAHSGNNALVFYDSVGNIKARFIPISTANPGAPAPGTYKVRVLNFGYSMYGTTNPLSQEGPYVLPTNSAGQKYNMQMQYADSTTVNGLGNIPFATVTPYVQISDYGAQQFLMRNLTGSNYLTNCGPLYDIFSTFNLTAYNNVLGSYLFPNVGTYFEYGNMGTTEWTNIGSYPFIAGGCYTIMVIGDIYAVNLDQRYGAGSLDDFAKIQVVNTNPNQQNMQVSISYSGGSQAISSLAFGKQTGTYTVPTGTVSLNFQSQGQTLYTYTTQVPRLGNYTFYYCADLTGIPFVFPQNNIINTQDYIYGSFSSPIVNQLARISTLDLCPDAGNVFYTLQDSLTTGNVESKLYPSSGTIGDVGYKTYEAELKATYFDGTHPPSSFGLRYTQSRRDSLAGAKLASLPLPFKRKQSPGSYTLVAAGLANTTDPAKKPILILVQHTNFIAKTTK